MRFLNNLAVMAVVLLGCSVASANDWAPTPHLIVQGEASLMLEADLVDLNAHYSVENQESNLAIQELEQDFKVLLASLKNLPKGASLEAGQINISPRQVQVKGQWQVSGYTASRSIKIKQVPVKLAGTWVEKLVVGKPNNLGPFSYSSSQMGASRNPAIAAALADAQEKAQLMAKSLGQKLGAALQIEEISSPQGIASRMMMADAPPVAEKFAPELVPGQLEAKARVRVVFALIKGR